MEFGALASTLFCGQCFRWEKLPDGTYEGMAKDRYAHFTPETLPELLKDGFWAEYFDTGLDYGEIREEFCRLDPALAEAVRFAPEIRVLKQDPWEALCTFLLSQCNNIARIRGMVTRLCAAYGARVVCRAGVSPGAVSGSPAKRGLPVSGRPDGGDCGRTASSGRRAFPRPEDLAGVREEDLRALGFGYRAPYVLDAARRVLAGEIDFDRLRALPLDEAREELRRVEGVGPKVADCVLLYGLHRLEAFPMDVWMKRAMRELFPGREPSWFGPFAGIAQQYLFHYSRCHPELFRQSIKI